MAKYTVKHTTILHNKKVYKEGSTIELTDEQAKRLADFLDLIPESKTAAQTQTKQANKPKADAQPKTATPEGEGNEPDTNGKDETVDNNNKGGTDGK